MESQGLASRLFDTIKPSLCACDREGGVVGEGGGRKGGMERGSDRRREREGGVGQGRTQRKQAKKDQVPWEDGAEDSGVSYH